MSIDQKTAAQAPASARTAPEPPAGFGHGRSGLVVPLILAVFSTYLLIGVLTMEVPEGTDPPGPTFFPTIVLVAGYVIAVLLALRILKTPEPAEPATFGEHDDVSDEERRAAEEAAAVQYPTFTDWRCVAWAVGGFLAFAALLQFAGWILAAALLFWCVARAMDSRTPLRDVVVALTVSSIVYLAFGVALGLNLPSGLIGGGF
ncbi:tripartite tricarboxylate transporter TctB family protein [Micrococcus sp. FDAARGOS_333]|uniref:tripartite tricarboxylate transporter TctB family protein n=1 Tax=Micrococcus sp. FDAARGOS_333 TaxID=1930558 RepID=UPI001D100759|nr:tripartite tricarboxylate transporter TctB family protein [Micrococcus sp. FDAARGOS_333]